MTKEQLEYVRSSLTRAADALTPGNAINTLYGAVLFLTKTLRRAETDIGYVDEKSLSYRRDVCGAMAAHVHHFSEMCAALPASAEAEKQLALLEQDIAAAESQMDGLQNRIDQLEKKRDALQGAIHDARGSITALEESIPPLQNCRDSLTDRLDSLRKERDQYTDTIMPDLERAITAVEAELDTLRTLRQEKQRQFDALAAQRLRLEEENQHIDALIRQEPDEMRALHEQHTLLERQLEDIRTAADRCSPEKQAELRCQIDEMSGSVETLKADCAVIKAQHEAMQSVMNSMHNDAEVGEKELIATLNEMIGSIDGHLHTQESELLEARRRADTFAERLEQCMTTRSQYAGWLDSVIAPLECMCEKAGLTRTENEELYKTFDPAATETVRKLLTDTGDNLTRLDEILRSGMQSAAADQRLTRRRAETNERFARSHD